jgi:hypothetical protein
MGKKIVKDGWVYDYDISDECRRKYDCELTDVRYVLGEQFDADKRNVLICIGINPSMAMPNFLDPTLRRVQGYAKRSGEYGAWYMLNIYPQRATNPNNMDTDDTYSMEIHLRNLAAIEELLSTIERADVWCAWGTIIDDTKRTYLSDLLFGNEDKNIQGIISLFSGNYHFKAYGATTKGYPKHPLLMGKEAKLRNLDKVGLKELSDRITNKVKK